MTRARSFASSRTRCLPIPTSTSWTSTTRPGQSARDGFQSCAGAPTVQRCWQLGRRRGPRDSGGWIRAGARRSTHRIPDGRSMGWLHVGVVVVLLASGATSPAVATCVSKKCSDAALVERARVSIQQTCGCMKAGQPHRAYMTCVKKALKETQLAELNLERPCRNVVLRCESKSICGNPDAVVCCRAKKSGEVVASIGKSAASCKNAQACGASLGLYSTFDACGPTGTCAQEATTMTTPSTTTTTPSTTTTTIPPL